MLSRILKALSYRLRGMFRNLTAIEHAFIKQNSQLWAHCKHKRLKLPTTYIFVHYELYPLALLGNMHIASAIGELKNAGLLLISPSWMDRPSNQVLKSFPGLKLEYCDHPRYLFYRLLSYILAFRALASIKSPKELSEFKCDGILFGDTLYDTVLAQGFATIKTISYKQLFPVMASFFYNRSATLHIINNYSIIAGMSTHIVGVSGSVFLRYLLKRGIEVYIRETTLKKYRNLNMIHECCATPDKRYVKYMRKHPEIFVQFGEKALENRLGNKNLAEIDHLAYKAGKMIYTSRKKFCEDFTLSPDKKNIFVMMHAFNDYPHTYGNMIHQDFYHWFVHVLNLAKKNTSVNWIFKNHPYEDYYPTDIDVNKIFNEINLPHIQYMSASVNFNTSSLCFIGDAVITCLGTAGLEYSAFGIPCILASRCWYSGLGFTREPKNYEDFEKELLNISNIPRLNDEQIATAKMIAYFSFEAMNQIKFPDPFRTIATYDLDEGKTFSAEKMIETILLHRTNTTIDEKAMYMSDLYEFIQNHEWAQFVDFSRHTELKKALEDSNQI